MEIQLIQGVQGAILQIVGITAMIICGSMYSMALLYDITQYFENKKVIKNNLQKRKAVFHNAA